MIFIPGKITFLMDGQAGSSGKARTASYFLEKYRNHYTFVCNTFSANAAHWVKKEDGRKWLYKALNSNAYDHTLFQKMYIGPGSEFELETLLAEIEENQIPHDKIGIHPLAIAIQQVDADYEKGLCGFDGEKVQNHNGTMLTGSTCSGVGTVAARRLLRRIPHDTLAKNIPELSKFICDTSKEILDRLAKGESGFQEIAQGYQLSLMHQDFYPNTTYRNVTVAHALSDMFLPVSVAGPVILNYRTFPIRISNSKYLAVDDGRHLTWDEVEAGVPHSIYTGNSGGWYADQLEITWDQLQKMSGSPDPLMELTSKTKLPRRVATFSRLNLRDSIRHNMTPERFYLTLNFADHVDHQMKGKRSRQDMTPAFKGWLDANFQGYLDRLLLIGTGPLTEDCIDLCFDAH